MTHFIDKERDEHIVLLCACGMVDHCLYVEEDEGFYDIGINAGHLPFRERLKLAWRTIRQSYGYYPFLHVERNEMRKLAKAILELTQTTEDLP